MKPLTCGLWFQSYLSKRIETMENCRWLLNVAPSSSRFHGLYSLIDQSSQTASARIIRFAIVKHCLSYLLKTKINTLIYIYCMVSFTWAISFLLQIWLLLTQYKTFDWLHSLKTEVTQYYVQSTSCTFTCIVLIALYVKFLERYFSCLSVILLYSLLQ